MNILETLKRRRNALFLFILLMLSAVIYGQTLKFGYTNFDDDALVLHNQDFISDYKNIPKFFTKTAFYSASGSFYRPVLTLSLSLDAMISGKNPFMYHFTNVLLHSACVLLIFIFLKKLKLNETYAFLLTAVFASHPAFGHAVAWIPGRNDLLIAFFVLSGMIFLFDYYQNGKKSIFKYVFAVCMFTLALFTKESAVVLIAVVPVFMFLFCKNVSKKDYAVNFFILLLIFSVYAALRYFFVSIPSSGIAFIFSKSVKAFFTYFEYIVIPSRIQLFPETFYTDVFTYFSFLIMLIPLAASLFFDTGKKKIVLFGAFWFIIFLLPSFMSSGFVLSLLPHRLYVPFIGILIMFIEFFDKFSDKVKISGKYMVFFLSALVLLLVLSSYFHAKKFTDKYTYISHAIEEQRDSQPLRLILAKSYADDGRLEEAKKEIFRIESKDGTYSSVYYEVLGYVYSLEGNYENAISIFAQLHEMFPYSEAPINNLSEIYYLKGEYDKALEYAEKLIEIRPEQAAYRQQYAKIKDSMAD